MLLKKIRRVMPTYWFRNRHPITNYSLKLVRQYADAAAESDGGNRGKPSGGAGKSQPASVFTEEYKAEWKNVAPMLDLPQTPTTFMSKRPDMPATLPVKLTVNFLLPSYCILEAKEVDMVIVPASIGMMGLLPGHVPIMAQLKAGVVAVHEGTEVKKFFVSSGFAIMHANSVADIVGVEAVPIENLDIEAARKGLADYTQKQNTATTDLDKAEAQIAIEVYEAIVATLS